MLIILICQTKICFIGRIKNAIEEGDTTVGEVFKMEGAKLKKASRFNFSTESDTAKPKDTRKDSELNEVKIKESLTDNAEVIKAKEPADLKSSISSLGDSSVSKKETVKVEEVEPVIPASKKRGRGRPKKFRENIP